MNDQLMKKLSELPKDPGVYFHKAKSGEVIYVGKAAVLRNRVRQYFQKSRVRDVKTDALVAEIHDTDWITVETELDALFLESEMIKRYKPRYNILLRDDKSQLFVRINMNDLYPNVTFTRGPLDDDATYFGPYYHGPSVRRALQHLRRIYPYSTHVQLPHRACLQYHLGLCPGVEEQRISSREYKENLKKLIRYLRGERPMLMRELERSMREAAKAQDFEQAALYRNKLRSFKSLNNQIVFSDKEFMDLSKDQGLVGLQRLLSLKDTPKRIEGYDISHMSGTNNVASMVVATNGLADKAQYRKFKLLIPGNDDFAHMNEALGRRFSGKHTDWPNPDLLLIDGGKGQLGAAIKALEAAGLQIPVIGLAKREEEIVIHKTKSNVALDIDAIKAWAAEKNPLDEPFTIEGKKSNILEKKYLSMYVQEGLQPGVSEQSDDFILVRLPKNSHIVKLLQRVRDESHRFAVSYHSHLKRRQATTSILDGIPGIGPKTRKKLVEAFGSGRAVKEATEAQLVASLGEKLGQRVYNWLHSDATTPT